MSDRKLLVIGNGPSTRAFADAGFTNLRSDVDTFGMGIAYRYFREIGWWPDYYAIGDAKVVHSHRQELEQLLHDESVTTKSFFLAGDVSEDSRCQRIDHCSTGDFCLLKALQLGYKKIYLIGIEGDYVEEIPESRPLTESEIRDWGYDSLGIPFDQLRTLRVIETDPVSNPNYFFSKYQQQGDVYTLPQSTAHRRRWSSAADAAYQAQAQVLNISVHSRIDDFPRCQQATAADELLAAEPSVAAIFSAERDESAELWFGPFSRDRRLQVDESEAVFQLFAESSIASRSDQSAPAAVMLDVGACRGAAFRPFAETNWSVHAFEPNPPLHEQLLRDWKHPNVNVSNLAVSDTEGEEIPFYTSSESLGISTLKPFRTSHKESFRVKTTTLDRYCSENNITHIDFLKIDAEGFDLPVLKGLNLSLHSVGAIVCEFEDAKSVPLGYSVHDMANHLVTAGYSVYVSEWHPVERYGGPHQWRALKSYPCQLEDPGGWGNLFAFKSDPGFHSLLAAVRRSESFRIAQEHREPEPLAFYASFGERIKRLSPSLFLVLRSMRRAVAYAWKLKRISVPVATFAAALFLLGFLAEPVELKFWIWALSLATIGICAVSLLARRLLQNITDTNSRLATLNESLHAIELYARWNSDRIALLRTKLDQLDPIVFEALQQNRNGLERVEKLVAENQNELRNREKDLAARLDAKLKEQRSEVKRLVTALEKYRDHTKADRSEVKRLATALEKYRDHAKADRSEVKRLAADLEKNRNNANAESSRLTDKLLELAKANDEQLARRFESTLEKSLQSTSRTISDLEIREQRLRERLIATERQLGQVRYPGAPDCYVLFGHHKCASRFFRNEIFAQIAEIADARIRQYRIDNPPFHYEDGDDLDLLNMNLSGLGVGGRDVVLFSNATGRSLAAIRETQTPWKGLRIIRDPRQVLVSGYLHHKSGHLTRGPQGWVWDRLAIDQPVLNELPLEEGLIYELNHISKQVIEAQLLADFSDERILTLKLEDFAADPKAHLLRIAEFLEVPELAGLDLGATRANPDSDLWRNVFTPRITEIFKERYGRALIDLGYETDLNW